MIDIGDILPSYTLTNRSSSSYNQSGYLNAVRCQPREISQVCLIIILFSLSLPILMVRFSSSPSCLVSWSFRSSTVMPEQPS